MDLTLTVTNPEDTTVVGGCERITSDTLTLTVTPNPTADAGPNQTLCVGDDIVVAGTVTNEDSIQWAAYFNDTYLTTPETASGIFTTQGLQYCIYSSFRWCLPRCHSRGNCNRINSCFRKLLW